VEVAGGQFRRGTWPVPQIAPSVRKRWSQNEPSLLVMTFWFILFSLNLFSGAPARSKPVIRARSQSRLPAGPNEPRLGGESTRPCRLAFVRGSCPVRR
jgi:hypothetical protein